MGKTCWREREEERGREGRANRGKKMKHNFHLVCNLAGVKAYLLLDERWVGRVNGKIKGKEKEGKKDTQSGEMYPHLVFNTRWRRGGGGGRVKVEEEKTEEEEEKEEKKTKKKKKRNRERELKKKKDEEGIFAAS